MEREKRKYCVSEMFNFVIVTFIDGSLGEVSIKSTVANRNSSQENCTNSLKPNSKFFIPNLTYVPDTSVLHCTIVCCILYWTYNRSYQHNIGIYLPFMTTLIIVFNKRTTATPVKGWVVVAKVFKKASGVSQAPQ